VNAGERESMWVLYGSTFLFGIVGTMAALAMIRVKSALDMWWNLQGIFTGGMLGLFLLGLISRRARNPHAIVAVSAGVFTILWLSLSNSELWPTALGSFTSPLHSFMTIVVGTSTIVLTGVCAASFMNNARAER
jgi:SSS family solute:Na+ symporter